jgi:FMN phosphatase YigB (HAD superfamily)
MAPLRVVCFDWGGTLMPEDGPADLRMVDWPQVRATGGARELLDALAPRYTLCVATNARVSHRPDVERALERVGLLRHIAHIFCFSDLGVRKDTAQFWQEVTRTLACTSDEILMVGDSLEQDVLGPAAHGVRGVWFNPDGERAPPGVTAIRHLSELLRLLPA